MPDPQVVISQRGADRLANGHLWVYRSDVRTADAQAGDAVRVLDERGRFIGRAFYSDRSQIAIRLLTRQDIPIDRVFLRDRIRAAADARRSTVANTDCFRLVYGEADQLPSLIVDRYADCLSIQTLSQATERRKPEITGVLQELFSPRGIIERNDPKVRLLEGLDQRVSVLAGDVPDEIIAQQNGITFAYDLYHGQKTGCFLDQRENHAAAAQYASGEALDCFTYIGGFALTCAPRCTHVEALDLSAPAVAATRANAERNSLRHVSVSEGNAFDVLKNYDDIGRKFDFIILDPPAFAKNRLSVPAATRGYKEINLRALKILRPGGFLVTCSCSHHIPESLFLEILADSSKDAHRLVSIVERRTQSRDHPILLTVPETHYLKCFIIKVLE